jgi:hypothetical protein
VGLGARRRRGEKHDPQVGVWRHLDYLTEVDIETLATVFACATAMIGLDMFMGDKMRAQALMDRFGRSAGVALLLEEPEL